MSKDRAQFGIGEPTVEYEAGVKEFLLKDYRSEDKSKLVTAFSELMKTPEGQAAIQSRFDHLIPFDTFARYLDSPLTPYRVLATTPQGEMAGWGEYFIDPKDSKRAELSRLVVPQHQGRGVGTLLLERLLEKCPEVSPEVTRIESITRSGNKAAIGSLLKVVDTFGGYRENRPNLDQVAFIFPLKGKYL